MPPTPEQIAKLPRWAQDHISQLKRQLADETRTNAFYDGKLATDTFVQNGIFDRKDQPLVSGCNIQFNMESPEEGRRAPHVTVRKVRGTDYILVMGTTSVIVEPHSSNCFYVKLKRD